MFAEFARHHSNMLDRMIRENENRVRLEAQQRMKVTLKVETPKERVRGRQSYQLLLKMVRDPDYYEKHRALFMQALDEAHRNYQSKDSDSHKKALEEQRIAAEVAKLLLDRHRAKLARIVVERPYLDVDK